MRATLGRIVHYRSRTGAYTCAALVTATPASLNPAGVAAGHVPALTGEDRVHLAVFTPGRPGMRAAASDFLVESPHGRGENVAGTYQEFDVPFDPDGGPGTWCWPPRV